MSPEIRKRPPTEDGLAIHTEAAASVALDGETQCVPADPSPADPPPEALVEQRIIGHAEGQAHAIADVNRGWVDDLIQPRLETSHKLLQAVLDAISGKLDPSTQLADHPNVKFAQMERLKLLAGHPSPEAQKADA